MEFDSFLKWLRDMCIDYCKREFENRTEYEITMENNYEEMSHIKYLLQWVVKDTVYSFFTEKELDEGNYEYTLAIIKDK